MLHHTVHRNVGHDALAEGEAGKAVDRHERLYEDALQRSQRLFLKSRKKLQEESRLGEDEKTLGMMFWMLVFFGMVLVWFEKMPKGRCKAATF